MKTKILTIIAALLFTCNLYSQNITNTLGTNGLYLIKDPGTTFLTLKQSNGFLGLGINPTQQFEISKNFKLPATSDSNTGVIYKGSSRFIHNYKSINTFGRNTFVGLNSGNFSLQFVDNYSGSYNVGIGDSSLNGLTTGSYNVALGTLSMSKTTTGSVNTAVGHASLMNNLTGLYNVSVGVGSMYANTSGSDNVSLGTASMSSNLDGNSNTAMGFNALYSNFSGSNNIGIGKNSLMQNTTGNNNTAIGYSVGSNLQTGSNNSMIGYNSQPTSSSVSNQITLGNNQITSLRCNVQSITSLSDKRDKKNVNELTLGLEFINKLKPRQFSWDKREWYENSVSDGSKTENKLNAGFIAQELDEVQSGENADWLGLVNKDNPEKIEATYGNLLPVMVKAIQDLSAENKELRSQLESMNDIKVKFAEYEQLQSELKMEIEKIRNSNEKQNNDRGKEVNNKVVSN